MRFLSTLLGRATRAARAQTGQSAGELDDATFEADLKRAVRDMRAELNQVVQVSAEAMSAYNRLEADARHHRGEADQWKDRARKALESGDEEPARKALARKQECERRLEAIEPSLVSAREVSEKLGHQVARLRVRIEDAERNASMLIARRNAAAAQKKVAQAVTGMGEDDNAFAALDALEESVRREEAEATVYDELSRTSDSDLEREFLSLGTPDVDSELEALKREMDADALHPADPDEA